MYSLTVSLYIVIITAKNWRTVMRDLIFIWDYFTFIWQQKVKFLLEIDQFVIGATPVAGATREKVHCHSKLSSFWFLCERSAQPIINRNKSFSSLVRINISCLNIEIIKIMLTLHVGETLFGMMLSSEGYSTSGTIPGWHTPVFRNRCHVSSPRSCPHEQASLSTWYAILVCSTL